MTSSRKRNSAIEKLISDIRDERGSVEAGLTLIPLTILFLLSAQLVFASLWGNWQRATQQGSADLIAIHGTKSGYMGINDSVRHEPLIGGGYLVISERSEPIPLLANFTQLNPILSDQDKSGSGKASFLYRRVALALSEVFTK